MKYVIFFVASLLATGMLKAQSALGTKALFRKTLIALPDSTGIYVNDGDSDRLFYYALPPADAIKGMLVLFPPNGETAEVTMSANSKLAALARDHGLLTVILSINHNLYLDKFTRNIIDMLLNDVLNRYQPPRNKIVLGGFSLGGMNAIRYTELAYEDNTATVVKPAAVYGVDPPLDWTRLYHSFTKAVKKNFSEAAVAEASYFLERLNHEFGGTPEAQPATYVLHSMYAQTADSGGNAQYLSHVPVRIYSDPDIDWQLKNRRVDYYDMNAVDGAAMINRLHMAGNEQAEFINALGKGYRPNGMRHPHSWSLAEPKECVQWIMRCLK